MKKIMFAVIAVLCLGTFSGCGKTEAQKQADCINNAKQIMVALIQYADDHKQMLPEKLTQLVNENLLPPEILVCPAAYKGESCTYEFLAAEKDLSTQKTGVFTCRRHPGITIVACPDGHVETITGELPALLTIEGVKKADLAETRLRCNAVSSQLRTCAVLGRQATDFQRIIYETPCPSYDADEDSWKFFNDTMLLIDANTLKQCTNKELELFIKLIDLLEKCEKIRNR